MGILASMCPRVYFIDKENLRGGFGEEIWAEIGKIPKEDEVGTKLSGKEISRKKKEKMKNLKKQKKLSPEDGEKFKGVQSEKTDELVGTTKEGKKMKNPKKVSPVDGEKLKEVLPAKTDEECRIGTPKKPKKIKNPKKTKNPKKVCPVDGDKLTSVFPEKTDEGRKVGTPKEKKKIKNPKKLKKQKKISPVDGEKLKGGPRALEKTNGRQDCASNQDVHIDLKDQPSCAPAAKVFDEEHRAEDDWGKVGGENVEKETGNPKQLSLHQNEEEKEVDGKEESESQADSKKAKKKRKEKKRKKKKEGEKVGDSNLLNEAKEPLACTQDGEHGIGGDANGESRMAEKQKAPPMSKFAGSQVNDEPSAVEKPKRRPISKTVKENISRQVHYLTPYGGNGGKIAPRAPESDKQTTPVISKELYSEHVFEMFEAKPSNASCSVELLSVENEEETIKGRCEFASSAKAVEFGISEESADPSRGSPSAYEGSASEKSKWAKLTFWKERKTRVVQVDPTECKDSCWDKNPRKKDEKASKRHGSKVKVVSIAPPKPSDVYRGEAKHDGTQRCKEKAGSSPGNEKYCRALKVQSSKATVDSESCVT